MSKVSSSATKESPLNPGSKTVRRHSRWLEAPRDGWAEVSTTFSQVDGKSNLLPKKQNYTRRHTRAHTYMSGTRKPLPRPVTPSILSPGRCSPQHRHLKSVHLRISRNQTFSKLGPCYIFKNKRWVFIEIAKTDVCSYASLTEITARVLFNRTNKQTK